MQVFDSKGEQKLYELVLKDAVGAPEDGALNTGIEQSPHMRSNSHCNNC
jgi:hypothetical protein